VAGQRSPAITKSSLPKSCRAQFSAKSLVDEKPRSATVRTAGATTVAVINCEKLKLLLKTDLDAAATVYRNLARALAVKLRVTTMRLDAAATSLEQ